MPRCQNVDAMSNLRELHHWSSVVRPTSCDVGCNLIFECANTYLKKLVEIRSKNSAEFQTLKEWYRFFSRKRKDTFVEIEPTEFAINKPWIHDFSVLSAD